MEKESLIKIGISFITILVLFILVFSSPAEAFLVGLTTSDTNVTGGSIINFLASININSLEFINVDYILLKINSGNNSTECKFLFNGTIVSGCNGIKIIPILPPSATYSYGYDYDYGYGYGWNKGMVEYNITWNTQGYSSGKYQTSLEVITPLHNAPVQNGPEVTINIPNATLKECSVRAINGIVKINNMEFTKNKLNFYIPMKGAKKGNGNLVSQEGKNRFSYTFNVKQGVEDNKDRMVLMISGKLRIGAKNEVVENAILTLDKKTKKVSIIGQNINAQNLSVNFLQGCDSIKNIGAHDNTSSQEE